MEHTVFIIFGEMGSGKTYLGKTLATRTKTTFWDGDEVIPSDMLQRIKRFEPLATETVANYAEILGDTIIRKVQSLNDNLIVSRALYREEYRRTLATKLENAGIKVEFIWVQCQTLTNIGQLLSRPQGLRWAWYWLINKPFFQKPKHPHYVLYNY